MKIFEIYAKDWRNIVKVPTGIFLMIALMLLPSVYDWVNLVAVWDPYANTAGIKVAVTSLDEGTAVQGKTLNVGSEVIKSLKENKKLGWTFVDEEEAERGVDEGDYYASLLIPPDFSAKMTSILSGQPQKPAIVYTVNEKINAVAPKITGSGASSVTAQIRENFISTASEAVLTQLREAGIQLEEQLPSIRRVENGVLALEAQLPEIAAMGQKVLALEARLPEIHAKAERVAGLEERIPQLEEAGAAVLKVEEHWPQILAAGDAIVRLQGKLPELQRAAGLVTELDRNFYKVEDALKIASEDAGKAGAVVDAALAALPKLGALAADGSAFAAGLSGFLEKHHAALAAIPPVVKQNLLLLQQTADAVTQLTAALQAADLDPQAALALLSFVEDRLTAGTQALGTTIDLLTRLNGSLQSPVLTDTVTRLKDTQAKMNRQLGLTHGIASALRQGEQPAKELVKSLNALSKDISADLGRILARYDSEIVPAAAEALTRLEQAAKNAADVLQTAAGQMPNIEALLKDAQAGIAFGQEQLAALSGDLPQIRAGVSEAAAAIGDNMTRFTDALNRSVPFIQNDLPKVGQRVHEAADYVRDDLPKTEEEIRRMSALIREKLPLVESGVHQAADLVRTELPALDSAVRKAADKIREVKGRSGDIDELARLLRGDIRQESDFLASPVLIEENRKYPIPNYGSAMSPFYAVLSLWVGATLLISLLRIDVDASYGLYKGYELYLGRLLTFLTIGAMQAVCLTVGDLLLLEAYVVDKTWFVLFAVLISAVFVTITYTLVSVFGNTGKGIAIIFMVLQFTSSGGTFPISTASPFFQSVNPYVPFTYAISLLRETVGGMLPKTVVRDTLGLLAFIPVSYALALGLKKPLGPYTRRAAEKAKETKVIS
ncbi:MULTISPECIES: YhgE/Pip domain-containing protein [Paenibacillus]|uniref:YhgE/Pip domain-containing protein n=1 Tax=Paenibacillus TaxID=44249 RepID=UPI0022B879EF|nr:YhgE/Pip domain-containing protein [Paenibacillus caseinilyticus]MCZ8522820.1 YhgE/Pip domain-containing protein [Paenibacillus caseinilyticus]